MNPSDIFEHLDSINLNNNTVLIIEPRKITHLHNVLTNAFYFLKKEWNYVFYCGKSSFSYWKETLPSFFIIRPLECDNLTPEEYSNLLKSKELWESLYGTFVLTVQLDTWIFNDEPYTIDYYLNLNKSYIGGNMNYPWVELSNYEINPQIKNFNGGLSLRKKEDMLKIIESFPPEKTLDYSSIQQQQSNFSTYAEDVYFTIGCYQLKLNIGDDIKSSNFACHTISYDKCFGIHNPNSDLQSILNDKYPKLKRLNPSLFTR
jgi:hypothetical protein